MPNNARLDANSLRSLFAPRSLAIVGASESGGEGFSRAVYRNLEAEGFPVKTYLINPRREELWGAPCYPDIASLPGPVDLAVMMVSAEHVQAVLTDGGRRGLKAAIIFASRIGEGDDPLSRQRADDIVGTARANGVRLCGPNCLGVMSYRERLFNYPSADVRRLPAGTIGVAFQSGGTLRYWMRRAAERGLGFSYAVSTGNELETDLADYIDFLVEDESTKVIACLSEGIRRPKAFFAAARKAIAARKPVVILKTGRTEASKASAASHVGAISGDDEVFDAVCERYGIIRCDTLDDMVEVCVALSPGRLPAGNRIAVSGFTGLGRSLIFDYAEKTELRFSSLSAGTVEQLQARIDRGLKVTNPLDAGAGLAVRQDDFAEVSSILAADDGVDMLLIQGRLPETEAERGDPGVYSRIAAGTTKPVFAYDRMSQSTNDISLSFLKEANIPFLQRLPESLRAVDALSRFAQATRRAVPQEPDEPVSGRPVTAQDVIELSGIAVPWQVDCRTAQDVGAVASKHGGPVAIKLVSPQARHKTEVGAVRTSVEPSDAEAAALAMAQRLRQVAGDAVIEGYIVQEMVKGSEFILGVRDDPVYGPFLLVGMGGVFVELFKDVARCMLPASETDVRAMLARLRGMRLLQGYRGAPACDIDAVVEAALKLSRAFLECRGRIGDVEINPLFVLEQGRGVRAVDVRVT